MVPLIGNLTPGFTASLAPTESSLLMKQPFLASLLDVHDCTYDSNVKNILDKSDDLFSRMRSTMKSKYGTSLSFATLLYKAVFCPRVTYAASVWLDSAMKTKNIKKILSSQRRLQMHCKSLQAFPL